MKSSANRIIAALSQAGVELRTAQVAAASGLIHKVALAELTRLRMIGSVELVAGGRHKTWRLATLAPSNVVPIRPVAVAPRRMLPVVRRDDCAHEPECSMAAAKAWPEAEGMTCPAVCAEYKRAPRRAVSHPSNWMGGEG